ncbi:MAG: hypothetical protein QM784_18630 [Polyangiaceae bacterium]
MGLTCGAVLDGARVPGFWSQLKDPVVATVSDRAQMIPLRGRCINRGFMSFGSLSRRRVFLDLVLSGRIEKAMRPREWKAPRGFRIGPSVVCDPAFLTGGRQKGYAVSMLDAR